MFAATIVLTMLVAITAHPASFLSHALDNSFLNYLGARSYSIYLYQLPVFIFFDRIVPKHATLDANILKLAIVLILAELSYRYIENVFRKIKKPIVAAHPRQRFFEIRSVQLTMVVAMMLMVGTDYAISANATGHAKPTNNLEKRLNNNKSRIDQANKKAVATAKQTKQKMANQSSNAQSASHPNQLALSQQDHDLMTQYQLDANQFSAIHNQPVTAVGDSVMLDIAPSLQNLMPKTVTNAQVGRQAYWINGFADRDWITPNNTLLANQAKKYSNLHIVDWASLVQNHSDWLSDDQVHPNPTGSSQYASLIAKTIAAQNQ
ncbi:acyltransferase family protein [Weissella paramesenteroides]|uniref:acyltransferase family protein n=1 Tax=Weissella paramesenteroides TaxID=1249 RepID=UPI0030B8752E